MNSQFVVDKPFAEYKNSFLHYLQFHGRLSFDRKYTDRGRLLKSIQYRSGPRITLEDHRSLEFQLRIKFYPQMR